MNYKAILYESPDRFTIEEISEEESQGGTTGFYSFFDENGTGIYCIRKTKRSAMSSIKTHLNKQILEKKEQIAKLKTLITLIKDDK